MAYHGITEQISGDFSKYLRESIEIDELETHLNDIPTISQQDPPGLSNAPFTAVDITNFEHFDFFGEQQPISHNDVIDISDFLNLIDETKTYAQPDSNKSMPSWDVFSKNYNMINTNYSTIKNKEKIPVVKLNDKKKIIKRNANKKIKQAKVSESSPILRALLSGRGKKKRITKPKVKITGVKTKKPEAVINTNKTHKTKHTSKNKDFSKEPREIVHVDLTSSDSFDTLLQEIELPVISQPDPITIREEIPEEVPFGSILYRLLKEGPKTVEKPVIITRNKTQKPKNPRMLICSNCYKNTGAWIYEHEPCVLTTEIDIFCTKCMKNKQRSQKGESCKM